MLLETAQSKHVLLDNEVYHSGAKEDMTNRWELVINKKKKRKKKRTNRTNKNKTENIYTYLCIIYLKLLSVIIKDTGLELVKKSSGATFIPLETYGMFFHIL